ncbi:putative cytidine deaminase [Feldmannia species virus]|uniref:Putative cytidine deaminase n=1 Tax=Feldmannia species virus TaxID=39420 RepID=B5LWJ6_9PHYC|nr:putative cytidine deaminase [Feldmannia species virus]ACH46859.1 putative cytidine deaminase [Feldmannia species virus]
MKKTHETHFDMCRNLAKRSQHSTFRHGSIAVSGSSVVGKGSNRRSLHAEVSAVKDTVKKKIGKGTRRLKVYVCRVSSAGMFMNSRPCAKCMRFMRDAGVSKVYFSDQFGFAKIVLQTGIGV